VKRNLITVYMVSRIKLEERHYGVLNGIFDEVYVKGIE